MSVNLNIAKDARAESTIADLLIDLNTLRAASGRDPLQGWNSSKDKIIRSIETAEENVANLDPKIITANSSAVADKANEKTKVEQKKAEAKAAATPDPKAAKALEKAAATTADKGKGKATEAKTRFFPKGIFKSKEPVRNDARGKVWKTVQAKLSDGNKVEAHFEETHGTYFYIFVAESKDATPVCYSGKIADFAKMKNEKVHEIDLSKVA